MGVPLEIGKMFFYIMIPVSCFHYYSHLDPEHFRKMREEHEKNIFGNSSKITEEYRKKRAITEFQTDSYNPNDAFWSYGVGLKVKEDMEEKVKMI